MVPAGPSTRWRRVGVWVVSGLLAVLMLHVAARQGPILPDRVVFRHVTLLAVAVGLHAPYLVLRAWRAALLLDPVVRAADPGRRGAGGALIQGSGYVSFFVVMLLPLRLGELTRPLLLARAGVPGLGLPQALAAVAVERILDGVAICVLLFGGLAALGSLESAAQTAAAPQGSWVRLEVVGAWSLAAFVAALVLAAGAARVPDRVDRMLARGLGRAPLSEGLRAAVQGVLATVRTATAGGPALRAVAGTAAYWALTVLQLLCMARACGLELGWAAAAVVVAAVGLAIQLPGGPAQVGSFQLGMVVSLGLVAGDHPEEAAMFGFAMYTLQLAGGALGAAVGAWLLARAANRAQG